MPEPIIFAPEAETERSGLPPRMDIRAEPEAFGVGIAKAREEQAAAIGVGGEKIFNRAIELQHVNNETVKNNLAVQSAAELGALRADYDNKKGLDAQQGYDDYIKGVQAVRAKYTALAPNPDVKAMLDNELSMRIVRDSDFAGAHKSNEWQSYVMTTHANTQKRIQEDSYQSGNQGISSVKHIDEDVARAMENARLTVRDSKGEIAEGEADVQAKNAGSGVITSRIEGILRSADPNAGTVAYELYMHYKNAGMLASKDDEHMHAEIQTRLADDWSYKASTNAFNGWGPRTDIKTIQRAEGIDHSLKAVLQKAQQNHPELEMGIPELGGRRVKTEQIALFAQGRTAPGPIVTKTLQSAHLIGRAMDVQAYKDGKPIEDKEPGADAANAKVAAAIREAASQLGVPLKPQMGWDPNHAELAQGFDATAWKGPTPMTYGEKVKALQTEAQTRFPNFPRVWEMAEGKLHQRQIQHEQITQIEGHDRYQNVMSHLTSTTLPNGMRDVSFDAADPQVKADYQALPWELKQRVDEWRMGAGAEGYGRTPENERGYWRMLQISSGSEDEKREFLKEWQTGEFLKLKPTNQMMVTLNRKAKSVLSEVNQAENDHLEQVVHDDRVKGMLEQYHWDEKHNPNAFRTFQGAVREMYRARRLQEPDKPLTREERIDIAMKALGRVRHVGIFGGISAKIPEPKTAEQKQLWEDITRGLAERGYPPTEREKSSAYWAWTEIQRRMAAPGVPFKGAPKPAGAPEPEEGEKPAPTIRELTPAMGAQAREPGALRPEEMPTPEQAGERTRRMRETERERLEEKGRLAERMPPGSAIRRATEEQVRKRRSTTEAERE